MKVLSSRWSSQLDSFSFFPPSIVFKWEQDCLRIAGNPKPQVLRWVGVDVPCDCNHIVRILAPSTHTSCYTAAISLTLPHIHHAILLHILLHFRAYSMLRCCTFPCISTYIYIYFMQRCCIFSCTSATLVLPFDVCPQFHTSFRMASPIIRPQSFGILLEKMMKRLHPAVFT